MTASKITKTDRLRISRLNDVMTVKVMGEGVEEGGCGLI
jgi:hypothetical protein